ncbi:SNF2-related protein [Nitrolancea hollandica]|uniref:Putative Helicase domain protein n=1 Tax=Nitrolancea hollandica Lb TaxID=1129897 RepID=I4ELL3_9BACT|nr:SNF2-related protein [Nitrolancea hollandica]CCF85575.1 putative Helicase domain protein [Nitrolancea hollandica Lb]
MRDQDPRAAALTDNTFLPKVAERLKAEIEAGANRLDVVTGYIAPSAWAVLGNALEQVGQTRILLGKDYQLAPRTNEQEADIRALVTEALRSEGIPTRLPARAEAQAIEAALAFLRRDDVAVKVWTDGFLHAKAYILPGTVGVGSANFTAGGLIANRELVAWREDRQVVAELQQWFIRYWTDIAAVDYKQQLIDVLDRTTFGGFTYTPYEVLIRALGSRYGEDRPPSLESATFNLKWFQEDAVFRLIQMTEQGARGALLADAVGLGKTFMALGVIHHFLYSAKRGPGTGPPVLVLVPASMAPIWEEVLRTFGLLWACRIATLQSLNSDADVTPYQGAGLVIVDEAHRLRSRGVWYRKVMEILTGGVADKRCLLLTATPVNTGIQDLTTLLQVLTKNRRNVFAPAIADFEAYLKRVEKGEVDAFPILDRCVVRRSRSDILLDYEQRRQAGMAGVEKPKLPDRVLHHVTYQYAQSAADGLFDTFASTLRQLRLAPYDLTPYQKDNRQTVAAASGEVTEFAPGSLAALVAAGLLKRFESSLYAISLSLKRLDILLHRFANALEASPPRLLDLSKNPAARELLNEERDADEDQADDFDARWRHILDMLPDLAEVERYDLVAIREAIAQDRAAVARLRSALPPTPEDGKIAALRRLFQPGGRLHRKRTLLFTQFRDTAVYIHECLTDTTWRKEAGVEGIALIHGGVPAKERTALTASFDPERAGADSLHRFTGTEGPPQILVSTDVLAEGHNLQLAEAVVNFDLHWNPQVAVQRAGRIDRLNSPHTRVLLLSFLPEEGLDAHLGLVRALERRFHLIHLLGLGDEPVTKLTADLQTTTFEQMRRLYADDVTVLDEIERTWTLGSTDFMRAPLEAFLSRHAREKLKEIPLGVQSVKALPRGDWKHGNGIFIAFNFQGESLWRFYPRVAESWGDALLDESEIFKAIVCAEHEPRQPWPTPFPGPGGLIDWQLLRRAATEVAHELTRRRATAALQRGASERSRRLRQRIRELADIVGEVDGLEDLLDRLEEVRIEDFDHRNEMRGFQERVREASRATSAGQRHDLLAEIVRRGIALFGLPEGDSGVEPDLVRPEDLQLVAWEILIDPQAEVEVQQTWFDTL